MIAEFLLMILGAQPHNLNYQHKWEDKCQVILKNNETGTAMNPAPAPVVRAQFLMPFTVKYLRGELLVTYESGR